MNTISEYNWHGHDIKIQANASPKYLWLDYRLNLQIDNRKINSSNKCSLIRSQTSFLLKHNGRNLKGKIISAGFPLTPVISQLTIVDDSILGKSKILIGKRIFTYLLLFIAILSLNML
ncbi:MAG: hypothetical protein DIZ80_08430 [endosymbiont of Galathealinum brachiosum]|uniref:Uncharacterized protein n=1 Tax=endosymbiont of Galathealinum brachiosum TaxID=2200906 RepID=A0A370DDE0_9GAMM|nr:MAG: hypothetical protein DIZ80_08430 [endosymbiont of Galathealinum brachiosum]